MCDERLTFAAKIHIIIYITRHEEIDIIRYSFVLPVANQCP